MDYLKPLSRTYYFQTLDPLHVGTGGTRLGRVDNTIARDPATRLPKAPGPGISGAVKDSYDLKTLVDKDPGRVDLERRCAGDNGCGKDNCRVCGLFGTAPSEGAPGDIKSRRGVVAFRDAYLAAMPMASLMGPVWLTDPAFAADLDIDTGDLGDMQAPKVAAPDNLKVLGTKISVGAFLFDRANSIAPFNEEQLKAKFKFLDGAFTGPFQSAVNRLVVCPSAVFPFLVDTGMEVRTSVTIDPETGAARPKKLFTLEAVPAGAIFRTNLDFLGGKRPVALATFSAEQILEEIEAKGFPYLAFSGMGGNVTRGFGRVRFLCRTNG